MHHDRPARHGADHCRALARGPRRRRRRERRYGRSRGCRRRGDLDDRHAGARNQLVGALDRPQRRHSAHRPRVRADLHAPVRGAQLMSPAALVVVPTYNERVNLPRLVRGLMAHDGIRVLIVDDQSPDGTGEVADGLARAYPGRVTVRHRTGRKGFGRSYIDGMKQAIAEPVDIICQMDADLSHDPAQLPALIAATAGADVVIGSRYVPGGSITNWPLVRKTLSRFANAYIRAVTRLAVRDCTSGYRCWRRQALAALPLATFFSDGYSF